MARRNQLRGRLVAAAALSAVWLSSSLGRTDDPSPAAPVDLATLIRNADGISSLGRPQGYKLAQPARYYVWKDSDGWHLRVTAPYKASVSFRGELRLHNAKFLAVRPIGVDKQADGGTVSPDHRQLTFKFLTGGKFDGFDFNLDATDESQLEMELLINGKQLQKRIFIGSDAANPQAAHFAIKAKP
jgi:hypothetical protein